MDELVKRLRELASIPEHCENVADCDECSKEAICLSFTNKRIIEVATQAADAIEELSKPKWILAADESATREFFIDTPLGKLHVWAKHDKDCADDYPGVYVDLVSFWDLDGERDDMLACVEYDSADRVLQTCVYQLGIDEPVSIVRHESRVDEVR